MQQFKPLTNDNLKGSKKLGDIPQPNSLFCYGFYVDFANVSHQVQRIATDLGP
jgi:hypothetical protein